MKIAILLGDGMSGEPLGELEGRTTLEAAKIPEMDLLARMGSLGTAVTVPKGFSPGSDVANLSAFGYDPVECYTGRAPLEALSLGIELGENDIAYRMNLVTLLAGNCNVFMDDFSAGHITTPEAEKVVKYLAAEMGAPGHEFYPGVSYRHIYVWRNGLKGAKTTPPHDIVGKPIHEYLPQGEGADSLIGLITGSQILLKNFEVNAQRFEAGKKEANSIWLWGQGNRPNMKTYKEKYNLTGSVICAVDLIKGIGKAAGLKCPVIPGATGYLDTDYDAKAKAAIEALKQDDFVFVHVEAPDEAGHMGNAKEKVRAIENFDLKVVGPIKRYLENSGEDFAILIMPDHPTPVALKTHTSDPVPFILYESQLRGRGGKVYNEWAAMETHLHVDAAHKLIGHILGQERLW